MRFVCKCQFFLRMLYYKSFKNANKMKQSNFLQDFKAFDMKGNVIDMAVGVIIGGAFGKIVSSIVADVIMPMIGLVVGGVNFTDFLNVFSPL